MSEKECRNRIVKSVREDKEELESEFEIPIRTEFARFSSLGQLSFT
jgi:hypothetical protein